MNLFVLVLLAFTVSPGPGATLLEDGYQDMYNLQFDAAHRAFREWERLHPADPMGPASDAAAYLFFEFDRMKILRSEFFVNNETFLGSKAMRGDPQIRNAFEDSVARAKQLADTVLSKSPDDENALLATVIRIALHADYEALIDKQYWESLKEIKQARNQAEQLLIKYPDCYDANLAIGVENYLLSLKPAPVRLFLRLDGAQTDREMGVEKLRLVAQKGHYLQPYAKVLLAIAALRNNNKPEAKELMTELAAQFPDNDLFRDELKKLA